MEIDDGTYTRHLRRLCRAAGQRPQARAQQAQLPLQCVVAKRGRDYPYNRKLFKRIAHGWYQINPRLAIRRRKQGVESWHPALEALNLRLVHEFAHPDQWGISRALWRLQADIELPTPVAAEPWAARERAVLEAERAEIAVIEARRRAAEEARRRQAESRANQEAQPARWGTPEAKAAARDELRRRIEAQRSADKIGKP